MPKKRNSKSKISEYAFLNPEDEDSTPRSDQAQLKPIIQVIPPPADPIEPKATYGILKKPPPLAPVTPTVYQAQPTIIQQAPPPVVQQATPTIQLVVTPAVLETAPTPQTHEAPKQQANNEYEAIGNLQACPPPSLKKTQRKSQGDSKGSSKLKTASGPINKVEKVKSDKVKTDKTKKGDKQKGTWQFWKSHPKSKGTVKGLNKESIKSANTQEKLNTQNVTTDTDLQSRNVLVTDQKPKKSPLEETVLADPLTENQTSATDQSLVSSGLEQSRILESMSDDWRLLEKSNSRSMKILIALIVAIGLIITIVDTSLLLTDFYDK